jgi:hypothetical protein
VVLPLQDAAVVKSDHPDGLMMRSHLVSEFFHKECWSYLSGNGSVINPYTCKCGVWNYDTEECQYRLNRYQGDKHED